MEHEPHVMTREQAERYKERFKRATAKWAGQTMEVLSPEAMKRHLSQVKEAQDSGEVQF